MYQIGVDIGGTNIALGLVDENIEIIRRSSIPFVQDGGEANAKRIAEQIHGLLAAAEITLSDVGSIGLLVPGSIDASGSTVINAYNLGFHDEPLKCRVQTLFPDMPVFLANDANGAALAELKKGALKGCTTAAMLTLGTGVGGGLILGGRMFNGGLNNGVELGHMSLVDGGEPCTCGNRGCIEAYASATAIIREGRSAANAHPKSKMNDAVSGDLLRLNSKIVIDCAKAGDLVACSVFEAYVDRLGSAVASLINNLLDCERIAIGGGVCAAGEFLFAPLRENVHTKSFFDQHGDIVPAIMGNDAGIIGAAMLLKNET